MPYVLTCTDKPGALQIRLDNREAHLAYAGASSDVMFGGPFLDDDGKMCGSMVVLDTQDREVAQKWSENDPYAKAGLFESVTIREWKKVLG